MTLALGNYIIKLQRDISALQGVFTEYRIETQMGQKVEIPWREMAKTISQETGEQQIAVAQRHSLLLAIADETQGSALIRALHNQFLEEKASEHTPL